MSCPVIAPFVGIGVGIDVGLGIAVGAGVGLGIGVGVSVGLGSGEGSPSVVVMRGLDGAVHVGVSTGWGCVPHPAAIRMNRPTTHSFFTGNSPVWQ